MTRDVVPSEKIVPEAGTNLLLSLNVSRKLDVSFHADGVVTCVVGGLFVLFLFWGAWRTRGGRASDFEIDQAEFGVGQHKLKMKINDDDRQIAYKIWVELSTRKIGLPIELDQDVIAEVYDSWYTFFSVTRELVKDVPVKKYQRDSTAKIVGLSIEVLNEGLRPHLTKWQAKFRRWYDHAAAMESNKGKSPQEIQKDFPDFDRLSGDLLAVNKRLIAYRDRMHDLVNRR